MKYEWFRTSLKAYIKSSFNDALLVIEGDDALTLDKMIEDNKTKSEINQFIFESANTPFVEFKKEHELYFLDNAFSFLKTTLFKNEKNSEPQSYSISFSIEDLFDLMIDCESDLDFISVFRIEDDNESGIYTSELFKSPVKKSFQKMPYEERNFEFLFNEDSNGLNLPHTKKWFFAFESIDDLEHWFKDDLDSILEFINVYKIPQKFVIKGDKQVIFKKDKSHSKHSYI